METCTDTLTKHFDQIAGNFSSLPITVLAVDASLAARFRMEMNTRLQASREFLDFGFRQLFDSCHFPLHESTSPTKIECQVS